MRKTMIFAAVAALISLASCQKEGPIESGVSKNASPVFTASIAGATKTTVNVTDGKIAWEADDEITVADASAQSAVYVVESIDATTGKATFAMKDGETALGDGPYTASYGTEPATAQTYSATAGKLYMTAPATSDNSFTFTVQCGLMKLNLTKTGESVKSISVTSNSETTYTLTCDPAQSIATAKDFFIALPDGSYKKIEITNASDIKCTLNSTNGVTVEANHIKPVTFGESKLNFVLNIPDGALSGVFSVSATKKVHFSQGNLYYDGSKFNFEANQYDFRTYAGNNSCINGASSTTGTPSLHYGLFGWVGASSSFTGDAQYGVSTSQTASDYGNVASEALKSDWGNTIDNSGTWRTLSTAEWQYLFNNHSYKWASVNGVNGYVIAPDGFAGTLSDTYADDAALASAGNLVFLPAAGRRRGSLVSLVGDSGLYWSSTAHDESRACLVYFFCSIVSPDFVYRYFGFSVRLVTE